MQHIRGLGQVYMLGTKCPLNLISLRALQCTYATSNVLHSLPEALGRKEGRAGGLAGNRICGARRQVSGDGPGR